MARIKRPNYETDDKTFSAAAYVEVRRPGVAWYVLGWETEPGALWRSWSETIAGTRLIRPNCGRSSAANIAAYAVKLAVVMTATIARRSNGENTKGSIVCGIRADRAVNGSTLSANRTCRAPRARYLLRRSADRGDRGRHDYDRGRARGGYRAPRKTAGRHSEKYRRTKAPRMGNDRSVSRIVSLRSEPNRRSARLDSGSVPPWQRITGGPIGS